MSTWSIPITGGDDISVPVAWNFGLYYLNYHPFYVGPDEIYRIDITTGTRTLLGTFEGDPVAAGRAQETTLVNGKLYWVDRGGVRCFDVLTSTFKWQKQLTTPGEFTHIGRAPAVSNNAVIIFGGTSGKGKLYVLYAANGNTAFSIPDPRTTSGQVGPGPIVGRNGRVLVHNNGQWICFNVNSRSVAWHRNGIGSTLVVANGKLYANTGFSFACHDEATGAELWRDESTIPGGVSSMVVSNNILFISAVETFAFNVHTREQVWHYSHGGALSLTSKVLMISGGNSGSYAFRTPTL